jgi:hypothetical protein
MTATRVVPSEPASRLKQWLLEGKPEQTEGPYEEEGRRQHSWWQVMCLTGVDYFSTLGYQRIPSNEPVLFLVVTVCDPSEFAPRLEVTGEEVEGYRVLRAQSSTVPNAIAAFLLYLRDTTGKLPHAYFQWTEGNPVAHLARYILFGEGDIAPVVHEVLREVEPNSEWRPMIHVA